MASKQPLYGAPRPNAGLKRTKEITSSTSIAFTSQLSSLLAQSASSQPSTGRARPSKTGKEDIFKTHNKNSKKRAQADISSDGLTKGHTQDIGGIDPSDLHRSKRKMEEKARLYAAMKRGDYVPPSGGGHSSHNLEEHSLVDFDRKWADSLDPSAPQPNNNNNDDTSSGDGDSGSESLVDHEDEFGRLRRVPRSHRDRSLRRRHAATYAASQLESLTARPTAPAHIIKGDTIQSAAFNPDITISAQMAQLAQKRDRSLTPPGQTHYDAGTEIRSKGVGFYRFSKEEGEREREMGELEGLRGETERGREGMGGREEGRRREVEERRRVIGRLREERLAERFLRELG
ncbi:MAG: hypothetical protein L6R40_008308 [Gallowayella cf. fulva]|nr:MAG: hypothetical protein L6R40_008308 [Xanthomendoza cf. fulva]